MIKAPQRRSLHFPSPVPRRKSISQEINLISYDLYKESERLRTFTDNNWSNEFVKDEDLALLGFYFFRKPDSVKCIFCGIGLSEFEPNDEVLNEHIKFSPNCPLLKRRQTSNEPIDLEKLNATLPLVSYDECGSRRRKKSRVEDELAYPEYRLPSSRLESFNLWPQTIPLKPETLSEAGFFYSGQSDVTICFACGLYIGKWENDDNPWVEHKKLLTKDCSYINMNQDTVKQQQKQYKELQMSKSEDSGIDLSEDYDHEEIDQTSVCKICLKHKSSIVFLPCRHMAVCGQCVFGIENNICPICRTEITEKIEVFQS